MPAHGSRRVNGRALCCAARLIPLVIGSLLALEVVAVYIDALWPHDYEVELLNPLAGLIWLVPLVLAALAWKWHLIGGLAIVAAAVGFFFYFVLRPPYEAFTFYILSFPWALVYLGGGILHLVVWARERRSRQIA